MINTKYELNEILNYEKARYFSSERYFWESWLVHDQIYMVWKYIVKLRKTEFFHNKFKKSTGLKKYIYGIKWINYRRRKNILGLKLGIEITDNSINKGLLIWHSGAIVINGEASIGKNCTIHGAVCIGNNGKEEGCPSIGDNVDIGVGAYILGNIRIANDTKIGAGAVVVNDVFEEGKTLVGIPAKVISH